MRRFERIRGCVYCLPDDNSYKGFPSRYFFASFFVRSRLASQSSAIDFFLNIEASESELRFRVSTDPCCP